MEQNELLLNTLRFLEMELSRLKVHVRRGILCNIHANELFFIFYRLYLMTDVSYGDGEVVILLSFDSSLMFCEQFCP